MDLLAFLLHHRFGVSRKQIFEKVSGYQDQDVESARRKFERDKEDLEALGIDIEMLPADDEEGVARYRLKVDGIYLPQIQLTDAATAERPYSGLRRLELSREELEVLDRATRRLAEQPNAQWAELARSVRRKLEFDLPLVPRFKCGTMSAGPRGPGGEALEVLQAAVAQHRVVACRRWTLGVVEPAEIRFEPYALLFQWGVWYVAGKEISTAESSGHTVLGVEDLDSVELLKGQFAPPVGFDVRELEARAPWEWGTEPATQVVLRIDAPRAQAVRRLKMGKLLFNRSDSRGTTFEMTVRARPAFLRWALSFGAGLRIEGPGDVVEALEALRTSVARIYAAGGQ